MTQAWHALDAGATVQQLESDPKHGLTAPEVARRLQQHGPNELTQEEKASPWSIFFDQFKDILVVILVVATILSAFVGEYVDAIIILVIILFCAILGFVQEYRAEKALDALKNMLTPMITVLREGEEREVASKELVPGDVLVIEAGDRIPADARLIEEHSLQADEAPLTGESLPVEKDLAAVREDAPVGDRPARRAHEPVGGDVGGGGEPPRTRHQDADAGPVRLRARHRLDGAFPPGEALGEVAADAHVGVAGAALARRVQRGIGERLAVLAGITSAGRDRRRQPQRPGGDASVRHEGPAIHGTTPENGG